MTDRRFLIAGNWKMNLRLNDATLLAKNVEAGLGTTKAEVLVCPPALYVRPVADAVDGGALKVGGQDCHASESGAHTGDIAAEMLADTGATYVIVGHSERRTDHGETDADVRQKAEAAHRAGLVAVICIGETEAERDAGSALAVLSKQIAGSLPDGTTAEKTVVAYEPVWAIGTGRTPTIEDIAEAHAHIRQEVAGKAGTAAGDAMRILYGGSMKPGNAAEILAIADVDGGLIGGASLKAEDFLAIVAATA
ncbi:MAG: triose-phosphate isomerase [Alphaproteobacteria bacterium]